MSVIDRDLRDVIGGAIIALVGAAAFYRSFAYGIGTISEMQAGFFPMVLSAIAVLLGIVIAIGGLLRPSEPGEAIAWRPLVAVLGGIGAFALLLRPLGLGPAVAAAAAIAALGDRQNRLLNLLVLGLVLAIACWLIFSVGLKLPLPLVRGVI